MYRNKRTMTYEEFIEAVKKESAELPVSKACPEDYEKEIARWEREVAERHYNDGDSVEDSVYYIDLMV